MKQKRTQDKQNTKKLILLETTGSGRRDTVVERILGAVRSGQGKMGAGSEGAG